MYQGAVAAHICILFHASANLLVGILRCLPQMLALGILMSCAKLKGLKGKSDKSSRFATRFELVISQGKRETTENRSEAEISEKERNTHLEAKSIDVKGI